MNKAIRLNLRYRTDPEHIRRVLPPLLEPDDEAVVLVDYALIDLEESFRNIFVPGPYYESGFHVSAKYRGKRGVFQIGMPLNHDWGRTMGREYVGYHKKDGKVEIEVEGDTVRACLWRRGALIHRIESVITNKPAHPLNWFREFGYGAFLYRFRLNSDWRQGPLSNGPVELWRLGGNDHGYPTEMITGDSLPFACDLKLTKFEFVDPSPLDPCCEFPPLELLAVTYHGVFWEKQLLPPRIPARPGSAEEGMFGPDSVFLEAVDKTAFEPWTFIGHDRPITKGKPWCPAGWPDSTTAMKLTPQELQDYRSRQCISLAPVNLIDIEMEVTPENHARTLPPQCKRGDRPVVRILAVQVGASDISTLPFNELWLFSRCEADGKPAYYALSHIVDGGGDVIYGRETLGYPSKMGTVELKLEKNSIDVCGRRLDRDFFHCAATISPKAKPSRKDQLAVLGIQMHPFKTEQAPYAELILQPWEVHCGNLHGAVAGDIKIDFPDSQSPGFIGRPDPWFELQPCRVIRLNMSQGEIYRKPAGSLGALPNFLPYYIERYDGIFGANLDKLILEGSKASFFVDKNLKTLGIA